MDMISAISIGAIVRPAPTPRRRLAPRAGGGKSGDGMADRARDPGFRGRPARHARRAAQSGLRLADAGRKGPAAADLRYFKRTQKRGAGATEMKYNDVAEAYDKLFKDDVSAQSWEGWNRGGPMPLVKELENFIASGDVLDIGAGLAQLESGLLVINVSSFLA